MPIGWFLLPSNHDIKLDGFGEFGWRLDQQKAVSDETVGSPGHLRSKSGEKSQDWEIEEGPGIGARLCNTIADSHFLSLGPDKQHQLLGLGRPTNKHKSDSDE